MSKIVTLKLPDRLAEELESLDEASLQVIFEKGLKAYKSEPTPRKRLKDYLKYMQTDDILEATRKAKEESRALLEDQGIAAIALMFSDVLSDLLLQSRETEYIAGSLL